MVTVEVLMIILKHENKVEIAKYLKQMTEIDVTLQSLEVRVGKCKLHIM